MKLTNFLKVLVASLFMIAIVGISCTKKEKPVCETQHIGTVVIYNDFPGVITVDVYDIVKDRFLGERVLGLGMSTTYTSVSAGDVEIWETDAYSDWGFWQSYVDQCKILEFSVYQGKGLQHDTGNAGDIGQKLLDKKKN